MSWNSLINSMFCFSPHAGNYPNTPSRMDPTNWLPKHDRSENMDILHMHRFNLEGNMLNTLTFFFHCLTNIESWSKLSVKHELETMHSGWFFSNNTLTNQTLRQIWTSLTSPVLLIVAFDRLCCLVRLFSWYWNTRDAWKSMIAPGCENSIT